MLKRGIIIAGGTVDETENIKQYIIADTIVACADSGYCYAEKMRIVPNAVIGDFDSAPLPKSDACTEIVAVKAEKSETDTQLCINYLAEKGVSEIFIFGALGGDRADHSFANIQLLEYGKKLGVKIVLKKLETDIFLHPGERLEISGNPGDILSVFALDKAEGICYNGLKYPLADASLTRSIPYCVSNEFIADTAVISVKKGELLIIHIRR